MKIDPSLLFCTKIYVQILEEFLYIICRQSSVSSLDQQAGIGSRSSRSARQFAHQISAILCLQLIQITEIQAAAQAGLYAGRLLALGTQSDTGIALAGNAAGQDLRSTVRAYLYAVATADAQRSVV